MFKFKNYCSFVIKLKFPIDYFLYKNLIFDLKKVSKIEREIYEFVFTIKSKEERQVLIKSLFMGLKSVPICVRTMKLMRKNNFQFKKKIIRDSLGKYLMLKNNFENSKSILLYLKSLGVNTSKLNKKGFCVIF